MAIDVKNADRNVAAAAFLAGETDSAEQHGTAMPGNVFETVHVKATTKGFHQHGAPFVTLVLRGDYTEVHGLAPRRFTTGSLVLHDAAEDHADYFLTDARCLNVELEARRQIPRRAATDRGVRAAARRVVEAFDQNRSAVAAASRAFESSLIRYVEPEPLPRPDWLSPVLDAFAWCDGVPLSAAAELAGVHPVQFSRVFHRCLGVTASAYRRRARMRRASELLLGSQLTLRAIAAECGFADQSHMTRTFDDVLGVSPLRFRRAFAR